MFTLVSNMKIPCLNLIIYNSQNLVASSTLIYHYDMIFYSALTCSSVVRLSYCIYPTCCSLRALDIFTPATYDSTDLVSSYRYTEGTICGNLNSLLLGDWLGSIDGLELGTNVGNVFGLSDRKMIDRTLGDLIEI